jgi:hypothetical protein
MSTTTEAVKPGEEVQPSPAYNAPRKLGATARQDRWWVGPAFTVAVLSLFGIYTILRVILSTKYPAIRTDGAHLQSPIFSPNLEGIFGFHTTLPWAFLVLWAPLGLRSTCYYYRKAYYRSFFLAPPACAVAGAQRENYRGETKFPWVLNNVHRYMWYAATIVVLWLAGDFVASLFYATPHGTEFGVSVGSGIMLVNVICLSGFTFGCNSWRHLIGGSSNCFDCHKVKYSGWKAVTKLNLNHKEWAWVSLFMVWGTDAYIWLAGSGVFTDPHHIF